MFNKLFARFVRKNLVNRAAHPTKYAAVEIEPKLGEHCEAVLAIHRKRFLSTQAPQIPIAGCNNKNCGCRYVYHTDRRDEPRRDVDFGLSSYQPVEIDRRHNAGGRRNGD